MMHGCIGDIQVSDDHLLLSAICDEHGLTAKWLAMKVGLHQSSVYRYLSGEATIPSVVWRELFAKTRDLRIVKLMVGEVPLEVIPLDRVDGDAVGYADWLEQRKVELDVERELLAIFADGTVDANDATAIEAYELHFNRSIATQVNLRHRILAEYKKARSERSRR